MFASFQSLRKEPKRSLTVKMKVIARVTVRVLQAAKKPQKVKMLYKLSVYIDKIQEATCFLFLFSVRAGSKI